VALRLVLCWSPARLKKSRSLDYESAIRYADEKLKLADSSLGMTGGGEWRNVGAEAPTP
jgi:hypothetical protein